KKFSLNKPFKGLLIPTETWRELENFSSGAICLVISSGEYIEEDYIRDYNQFLVFKSRNPKA
ncbi:MAG: WxcM-like domain-containing protein, partial [Flavobacteriaceae bacterium]|nr:WxcM-like domain-containing protein [Flavobacteriaceae bacterium]